MLGGNEHRRFDKAREARRFSNRKESRHVDYWRFKDIDDANHNRFEGRGGTNA